MSVEQFNRARELEDAVQKNLETEYLREVDDISNGLRNSILNEMISCANRQGDTRSVSMRAVKVLSEWKMFANAINERVKDGTVPSLRKVKEVLIDSASVLKKEEDEIQEKVDITQSKKENGDALGESMKKIFGKDMYNAVNVVANQLRNDMMASMIPNGSGFGSAWPRQSLKPWRKFEEAIHTRRADKDMYNAALVGNVMKSAVHRLLGDIQTEKKREVARK